MYCIKCGKENLDSAKFCNECGFDFRTLNREAEQQHQYVKVETPKAESKAAPKAAPVVEEPEEPKKKKGGLFKSFLLTLLLALAIFFVKGGGLDALMSEFDDTPPEPSFIVVPEPDSRYNITIEGAADDEFRTVMELLISERDTMETPVFVRYEWKALKQFKGATFEHEYISQLAPAYLQVVEAQQNLYNIGTVCRITDEDLHYAAQENKSKLIVYMMLYGDLMPGRDDVVQHYMDMVDGYYYEQQVVTDMKAQLVEVTYQTDANGHYLTYTNNSEMVVDVKFDCTYEYPDSYNGSGGYMFEDWTFQDIVPGETVRIDLTKLDATKRVNVKMEWTLNGLYLDGEDVYSYYAQYR